MPVEGPHEAGQLTVATGCRAPRLASDNGRLRFSYVQSPAPSPSSRFGLSANGKERHFLKGLQRLSVLDRRLRFSMLK